jgi:hypothetical protein
MEEFLSKEGTKSLEQSSSGRENQIRGAEFF